MPVRTRSFQHFRDREIPLRRAVRNHDPCENMSNATQHSRKSGDSRRRNSRGGRNRNSQNENRRGGDRDDRASRGGRDSHRSGKPEEFRPQSPRPPRGSRPVQLSWWQKLLKAIGLYKQPPQKRKAEDSKSKVQQPAKSNIRNARSESNEPRTDSAKSPAQPKRERAPRERARGGDSSTVESPRVYVGNLSYDVTEQDLQELFKGVGPVRNVEIVYNRSTHRSKGYGFVEMLHKDEAVNAVEVLNDQFFMGRKLIVSGAKSKGQDEREDAEDSAPVESRTITLAPIPQTPPAPAETTAAEAPSSEPAIEAVAAGDAADGEAPAATETGVETSAENKTETA